MDTGPFNLEIPLPHSTTSGPLPRTCARPLPLNSRDSLGLGDVPSMSIMFWLFSFCYTVYLLFHGRGFLGDNLTTATPLSAVSPLGRHVSPLACHPRVKIQFTLDVRRWRHRRHSLPGDVALGFSSWPRCIARVCGWKSELLFGV